MGCTSTADGVPVTDAEARMTGDGRGVGETLELSEQAHVDTRHRSFGARIATQEGISALVVIIVVVALIAVVVALIAVAAGVGIPLYLNQRKSSMKNSLQSDVRAATSMMESALSAVSYDENQIKFTGGTNCVSTGSDRHCTFTSDHGGAVNGKVITASGDNTLTVTMYVKLSVYQIAASNPNLKSGGSVATWTYFSQTGTGKWTPDEP